MSEDLVGRTLGKYELRERIGRGGMAEVYKAYHASLDRYVAIKILHPFLSEDPEFKERFEREARNIAQLRHPNIVQAYDFDFDPEGAVYFMVMEYIDGPTLRSRLIQTKFQGINFEIAEAVHVVRRLADALAYAHARGMVHRDIKPANVMLDADGRVVLTDFGIARIISSPNMTASGSMVGTPAYMSPEQGLGQPGDHRSDIYSLGVVLYQLVTGVTPFDADTPIAIVLKHVNDPLPPPSSLNPDIPPGLERILFKALAKTPEERYQSVEEMALHLDDLDAAARISLPAARETPAGGLAVPTSSMSSPDLVLGERRSAGLELEAAAPRRRGCLVWALLLIAALAAAVGGGYTAFTGALSSYVPFMPESALVLTDTPEPSATPWVEPASLLAETAAPAVNLEATAISMTIEALASLVGTPAAATTPAAGTPLPEAGGEASVCSYRYRVTAQNPANGTLYPELTTLTMALTILNDGNCTFDYGTRLEFVDGYQLDAPGMILIGEELAPGESREVTISMRTPGHNPRVPVIRSSWVLILPDGEIVGAPLTFELELFSSPSSGGGTGAEPPPNDSDG